LPASFGAGSTRSTSRLELARLVDLPCTCKGKHHQGRCGCLDFSEHGTRILARNVRGLTDSTSLISVPESCSTSHPGGRKSRTSDGVNKDAGRVRAAASAASLSCLGSAWAMRCLRQTACARRCSLAIEEARRPIITATISKAPTNTTTTAMIMLTTTTCSSAGAGGAGG